MKAKKRKLRIKKSIKRKFSSMLFIMFFGLVFFGFGSVYSWLFGSDNAKNYLNTPVLSVNIAESMNGTDYTGWVSSAINWTEPVPKYTQFTNTGESAIVIRVSYAQHWLITNSGNDTYLSNLKGNDTGYIPIATLHWTTSGLDNANYWTDFGDGWYYYRRVLLPNESTGAILDSVYFQGPLPSGYEMAKYELIFNVEACQYSLNPINENETAVWETFGMTFSENSGNLTWSNLAP